MPATWRSVDRFHAAGLIALGACGLLAPAAVADDVPGPQPNFFMTWDADRDSVGAFTYNWAEPNGGVGQLAWGTWDVPGGTGMDPDAQSHVRTGWRYWGDLQGEGWEMTWDCVVNEDPFVDATISVTNNSDSAQTFYVYMPLSIVSQTPYTEMFGSVSSTLTDAEGGATLTNTGLEPVYQGYIDGVAQANARMWDVGYSLTANEFDVNSDSDSFSDELGPAATSQIAIKLEFTLSAGDSATMQGTFDVMAVPGPAGLSLLALFGALGGTRRRRS